MKMELNPITATAALMIKDAEIAALKTELKNQRTLLVEHAGRLNNRIKKLQQGNQNEVPHVARQTLSRPRKN